MNNLRRQQDLPTFKPSTNHANNSDPTSLSETKPVSALPSLKTSTSTTSENKDEVFLDRPAPLEGKDNQPGFAERMLTKAAQKLNSDGDKMYVQVDAKMNFKIVEIASEANFELSRSGTPAKYTVSGSLKSLGGLGVPGNTAIDAFAGVGSNGKIEFSFNSREEMVKSLTSIGSNDKFKYQSMAVELGPVASASFKADIGYKLEDSVALEFGKVNAAIQVDGAVRLEMDSKGKKILSIITRAQGEANGAFAPGVKLGANKEAKSYSAGGFGGGRKVTVEIRRSYELPKKTSLKQILTSPIQTMDSGQRRPDIMKVRTEVAIKASHSRLNVSVGQRQDMEIETELSPGTSCPKLMMESMMKGSQGNHLLRDHMSMHGMSTERSFSVKASCAEKTAEAIIASVTVKGCLEDHTGTGKRNIYDRMCVPAKTH